MTPLGFLSLIKSHLEDGSPFSVNRQLIPNVS